MKNTTIIALALASLGIMSSQASTTLNVEFGGFYDGVTPFADGTQLYLFASTTGLTTNLVDLETSLAGVSLSAGSIFGGDKLILGVFTPDIDAFGAQGTGNGVAADISYTNGLTAGDALGWLFVNQTASTLAGGSNFGVYTSPEVVMPADVSNVSLSFLEEQFGGNIPDGALSTTNTIVPEPSAALLGALGALGLLRRRRI